MRTLRSVFLESVDRNANRPAFSVRGVTRTYAELDYTARRWAAAIVDRLGRSAERVGVYGSRSEVSYIAALASMYSGATFVPLNPRFPIARTIAMAKAAALDAIIADKLALGQLREVLHGLDNSPGVILAPELDGTPDFGLDTMLLNRAEAESKGPIGDLPPLASSDIAYLLFTSGSTGLPKGVPITHGNVRHFMDWAARRYAVTPDDRCSQTFDQTFDLSVFDMFVAWEAGACLYAMSPVDLLAPSRYINQNELTLWFSVPSVPAQMRKRGTLKPDSLPTLRWSLFCGEPLPLASAEAWQQAAPNSTVENLYGPTELTIACTVHRWDHQHSPAMCVNDMVSIGTPFDGLTALLVDDELRPVPHGEAGELCLCGPQTSPGYWKDPAKTAERFVQIPAAGLPGEVFYRTGDRVVQSPTGEYACLGRTDFQVKVLGFRVELGEIEAVLQRDSNVVQAVAMGWPVVEGSAQSVVAFVSGSDINTDALLAAAKSALSDYMVPSRIHYLKDMPLNANGKVDRGALKSKLERGELR